MTSGLFLCILVFVVALCYILLPFLSSKTTLAVMPGFAKRDLNLRKNEVLESLKELELDHQTQKLSDSDFKDLYNENLEEGALLIKQLEMTESLPFDELRVNDDSRVAKFCTQCGKPRMAGGLFCAYCGVKFLVTFLILLLLWNRTAFSSPQGVEGATQAPQMNQMPQFAGMKTGTMEGHLFTQDTTGKKTFLADQTMVIMVFKDQERILMKDKKTDAKGYFLIQNVFQDESFRYALGLMYKEQLYIIPDLGLKPGQDNRKIEFWVGPGSPYFVDMEAHQGQQEGPTTGGGGMASGNPKTEHNVTDFFSQSHQRVALVLVALTILCAFLIKKENA